MERRSYYAPQRPPRASLSLSLAPLLPLALLLLGAAPLAAQERSREDELEAIRDEITSLRIELQQLGEERASVSGTLGRTGLEMRLQERRVDEARAERRIAEEALGASERRVRSLGRLLAESREALRDRLVDLYRLGRLGSVRLLMSIRSEEHLLHGIRILRYLARREADAVADYLDHRTTLDFERRELLGQRRRVEELLEAEAARLSELREAERRRPEEQQRERQERRQRE